LEGLNRRLNFGDESVYCPGRGICAILFPTLKRKKRKQNHLFQKKVKARVVYIDPTSSSTYSTSG